MAWLATLICANLQTSLLTLPFGWAPLFLRGVAPAEITTRQLYVGVIHFIIMQVLGVSLVFFYPQLALRLPKAIGS